MKKNIKLNNLAKNTITEREMNRVKGGCLDTCCGCGCAYAGNGGSSVQDNKNANAAGNKFSPQPWQDYVCCEN
jgi:natural product precursor